MLWIKTLHIVFMVTWFAGLFYLPRLFVYHAMSKDKISHERFIIMERKLFFGIMTPGAFLTILFGGWLWKLFGVTEQWLEIKEKGLSTIITLKSHTVLEKNFKV